MKRCLSCCSSWKACSQCRTAVGSWSRSWTSTRQPCEEEEMVRSQVDLHVLPEWISENTPVDFSDWLLLVSAQMADLSTSSATWWDLTVSEARDWYKKHQSLKPLEKLKHLARPSAGLLVPRWTRLEKRASTMLLRSVPDAQRDDLVSSKDLSVLNIFCRLMLAYQPGGGQEKQAVLLAIESPAEASSKVAAMETPRWRGRSYPTRCFSASSWAGA